MSLMNRKGLSLVEMLIAGGILAAMATGFMQMFTTNAKTVKSLETKYELLSIVEEMRLILSSHSSCSATFPGMDPRSQADASTSIKKIKSGITTDKFETFSLAGKAYGAKKNIKIVNYSLQSDPLGDPKSVYTIPAGATEGETVLIVTFDVGKKLGIKKRIPLNVTLDADAKLTTCRAMAAVSNDGEANLPECEEGASLYKGPDGWECSPVLNDIVPMDSRCAGASNAVTIHNVVFTGTANETVYPFFKCHALGKRCAKAWQGESTEIGCYNKAFSEYKVACIADGNIYHRHTGHDSDYCSTEMELVPGYKDLVYFDNHYYSLCKCLPADSFRVSSTKFKGLDNTLVAEALCNERGKASISYSHATVSCPVADCTIVTATCSGDRPDDYHFFVYPPYISDETSRQDESRKLCVQAGGALVDTCVTNHVNDPTSAICKKQNFFPMQIVPSGSSGDTVCSALSMKCFGVKQEGGAETACSTTITSSTESYAANCVVSP